MSTSPGDAGVQEGAGSSQNPEGTIKQRLSQWLMEHLSNISVTHGYDEYMKQNKPRQSNSDITMPPSDQSGERISATSLETSARSPSEEAKNGLGNGLLPPQR